MDEGKIPVREEEKSSESRRTSKPTPTPLTSRPCGGATASWASWTTNAVARFTPPPQCPFLWVHTAEVGEIVVLTANRGGRGVAGDEVVPAPGRGRIFRCVCEASQIYLVDHICLDQMCLVDQFRYQLLCVIVMTRFFMWLTEIMDFRQ